MAGPWEVPWKCWWKDHLWSFKEPCKLAAFFLFCGGGRKSARGLQMTWPRTSEQRVPRLGFCVFQDQFLSIMSLPFFIPCTYNLYPNLKSRIQAFKGLSTDVCHLFQTKVSGTLHSERCLGLIPYRMGQGGPAKSLSWGQRISTFTSLLNWDSNWGQSYCRKLKTENDSSNRTPSIHWAQAVNVFPSVGNLLAEMGARPS